MRACEMPSGLAAVGYGDDDIDTLTAGAYAQQRLLKQWELAAADSSRIAVQLSEWAAQGDWRLVSSTKQNLVATPRS